MATLAGSVRFFSHLLLFRLKGGNPREYRRQWESYWRTIDRTGPGGEVLWDNVPERASEEDLARFMVHMDPALPLIDLGCGNGRQSRALARRFPRVIGVDVSPAAVELARREARGTPEEARLEFRVCNGAVPGEAEALHAEVGDANVYMRTVFHCVQTPDRPRFVASLGTLLGSRGVLYQIELSRSALDTFRRVPGRTPSGLPELVHNVVRNGIHPIGFSREDRERYYPETRWLILDQGETVTIKTVTLAQGREVEVPANYLVLRPRHEAAAAVPLASHRVA